MIKTTHPTYPSPHHDSPAIALGHFAGLNRFRDRTYLVDLEQEGVAGLALNGHLDALRIGY